MELPASKSSFLGVQTPTSLAPRWVEKNAVGVRQNHRFPILDASFEEMARDSWDDLQRYVGHLCNAKAVSLLMRASSFLDRTINLLREDFGRPSLRLDSG